MREGERGIERETGGLAAGEAQITWVLLCHIKQIREK